MNIEFKINDGLRVDLVKKWVQLSCIRKSLCTLH